MVGPLLVGQRQADGDPLATCMHGLTSHRPPDRVTNKGVPTRAPAGSKHDKAPPACCALRLLPTPCCR